MNAITFIWPPHCEQTNGSNSYTRLISIAHVWLERLRVGPPAASTPTTRAAILPRAASAAFARTPCLVGIPAIVPNEMRSLRRNVLRELGQEIQRREDLEVPLHPAPQAVVFRIGKRPAGLLLRLVDHLPAAGHLDEAREAKRATRHVLHHALNPRLIPRGQKHRLKGWLVSRRKRASSFGDLTSL